MGISPLNDLCFLFLEYFGATANFFASGPSLVTNRKALILYEENIDHGIINIFKWWSHALHCAH